MTHVQMVLDSDDRDSDDRDDSDGSLPPRPNSPSEGEESPDDSDGSGRLPPRPERPSSPIGGEGSPAKADTNMSSKSWDVYGPLKLMRTEPPRVLSFKGPSITLNFTLYVAVFVYCRCQGKRTRSCAATRRGRKELPFYLKQTKTHCERSCLGGRDDPSLEQLKPDPKEL
jgi:hypothetical protein